MSDSKRQKALLEWFMIFLYADLEALSLGDLAKMEVEIGSIVSRRISAYEHLPKFPELGPEELTESLISRIAPDLASSNLVSYQDYLRRFFESLIDRIQEILDQQQADWMPIREMDSAPFLARLEMGMKIHLQTSRVPPEWKETEPGDKSSDSHLCRFEAGQAPRASIALLFEAPSHRETLLFYFVRALEGIPLGAFRRCPECERGFIHLSEREKLFCTNLCAARHGVRKRRALRKTEDPKGYEEELRENAERAHRSYARAVPLGKPKRRPYKHKPKVDLT